MDVNITLSDVDLATIVEALDCYDYWELGQGLPRNNGAVLLPGDALGDSDPYWTEPPTDAEAEAIECSGEPDARRASASAHPVAGDRINPRSHLGGVVAEVIGVLGVDPGHRVGSVV